MNNGEQGKSASHASKTSLAVHLVDLAAGNQRMQHDQAILNTIAY
jgi:hypothetical protein